MGLHTGARQLTREEWGRPQLAVFNETAGPVWPLGSTLTPGRATTARPAVSIEMDFQKRSSLARPGVLTLQHVQINGRTENDAQHLLTLCWGHHLGNGEKGGRIWSKQKKPAEPSADHLINRYPEIEAA
jgi:hypothetical protein